MPLDILVGLDLAGVIRGAVIAEHHEPILIIGVSDADLNHFQLARPVFGIAPADGFLDCLHDLGGRELNGAVLQVPGDELLAWQAAWDQRRRRELIVTN